VSDDYILKIGLATENEAKLALFHFLQAEYSEESRIDPERPEALAASVTNRVFGEESDGDANAAFAKENPELITTCAREIGKRNDLCKLLSGAAYNTCYARYLRAGGKRSMFSNRFLGYVRAGRDLTSPSNRQIQVELYSEIALLGRHILRPMDAMATLGISRPLPYSPNERDFYNAVHEFARRVGVEFAT
jgi:hypothetical protein